MLENKKYNNNWCNQYHFYEISVFYKLQTVSWLGLILKEP